MVINVFFQEVFNRYLGLDPEANKRLSLLAGKIVALKFKKPSLSVFLSFVEDKNKEVKVKFLKHHKNPDAIISGTPLSFIHVKRSKEKLNSAQLNAAGITVEGNMDVARDFNEMMEFIDVDWEECIAQFTGDVFANTAVRMLNRGKSWSRNASEKLKNNFTEFVQEEIRLFPSKAEIEDFIEDVRTLSSDVDRAQAKINRLVSDNIKKN